MIKRSLLSVFLIAISLLVGSWGSVGHRAVAGIAENHLTPRARKAITELLGNISLADVANWADEVRPTTAFKYTAPWHYVNVTPGLSFEHFAGKVIALQPDNIYSAILKCKHVLLEKSSSREQKTEALKFLIHFVADAHQPMHTGRAEDRGGNSIQVQFNGQGTNLHSLWDSELIDRQGLGLEEMVKIYDRASDRQLHEWQSDDVMKWLFESYEISSTLYAEIDKGNRLGDEYYNSHVPIVEQRIVQGGIRLAGLLNDLFKYGLTASTPDTVEPVAQSAGAPVQEHFPLTRIDDVMENIGKSVTIVDMVADYKVINPSLTLLNLGAKYPNQKLTVALKGNQVKLDPATLKNKKVRVSGAIELFKDRPEIVITDPADINVF